MLVGERSLCYIDRVISRRFRPPLLIATLLLLAGAGLLVLPVRARQSIVLAGPAWQRLDDGLLPHTAVTAIACDPYQANTLYVGTAGPDGLWISKDGGITGSPAGGRLAGQAIYAILPPSEPHGPMFVGATDGLYVSTDRDNTWLPRVPGSWRHRLRAGARSRGRVLASGSGPTIYRGTPATPGFSWSQLAPLPGADIVLALAAAPQGALLLAGTGGSGLFRSDDDGNNWQPSARAREGFRGRAVLRRRQ